MGVTGMWVMTCHGAHAETGDGPWDGELPKEVLKDIEAAKGKVFEMAADPWW